MKERRDQFAHFAAAVAILLPMACFPNFWAFVWAGFAIGMVREITEEGSPVTFVKVQNALLSWLDLSFWTLGGAFVGVLYALY